MAISEVQERNVEFTRRSLGAWIAGDRSGVIEALAGDIEVFVPSELANTGSYRGKDEFVRWIADWDEAWANLDLDVRDLTPVGDRHVIALLRQSATGRGSGIPVEMELAFLTDVGDGKIAALHLYSTVEEARQGASHPGHPERQCDQAAASSSARDPGVRGASTAELVAVGEILRPSGLQGELRVRPLTDRPRERFGGLRECFLVDPVAAQSKPCRIVAHRHDRDDVLVRLDVDPYSVSFRNSSTHVLAPKLAGVRNLDLATAGPPPG